MDPRRLRLGERLAGVGGVALLAVEFLSWYAERQADDRLGARELSAWEAFGVIDVGLALTGLVGIAVAVLAVVHRSPALPVALAVVSTGIGSVMALLVAYRLLDQPGADAGIDVRFGAYLGLGCVLAITAGGWLAVADERTDAASEPVVPARPAPPVGARATASADPADLEPGL